MTTLPDYYLVTFTTNQGPYSWVWEIMRRSKPMGIRYTASGFESQATAEIAGARLLKEFLEALAEEEKRKR